MQTWSRLAKCTDELPLASPRPRRDPRHMLGIHGRSSAALRQRGRSSEQDPVTSGQLGKHSCATPQLFHERSMLPGGTFSWLKLSSSVAGFYVCCDPSVLSLTAMPRGMQRISCDRLNLGAPTQKLMLPGLIRTIYKKACVTATAQLVP